MNSIVVSKKSKQDLPTSGEQLNFDAAVHMRLVTNDTSSLLGGDGLFSRCHMTVLPPSWSRVQLKQLTFDNSTWGEDVVGLTETTNKC